MQFLLLIYDAEANFTNMSPEEVGAMYQEYGKFTQEITAAGKHRAGSQLKPISSASTVRVRNGKRVVTDGPFAETKEQLGGYYLVEATDLDDAIAMAGRIPSARTGSIEVRPLWVHEARADSAKG
jgi:hypothetical protein